MDTAVIPSFSGWPDLPTNGGDINILLHWMFEHDPEWMADTLWLRYIKLARHMYSGDGSDVSPAEWAQREADFDEMRLARQKLKKNPPIPFTILPSIPPSDGTDRLSALPHDLRFQVLSHLVLPYINPDNRKREVKAKRSTSWRLFRESGMRKWKPFAATLFSCGSMKWRRTTTIVKGRLGSNGES